MFRVFVLFQSTPISQVDRMQCKMYNAHKGNASETGQFTLFHASAIRWAINYDFMTFLTMAIKPNQCGLLKVKSSQNLSRIFKREKKTLEIHFLNKIWSRRKSHSLEQRKLSSKVQHLPLYLYSYRLRFHRFRCKAHKIERKSAIGAISTCIELFIWFVCLFRFSNSVFASGNSDSKRNNTYIHTHTRAPMQHSAWSLTAQFST